MKQLNIKLIENGKMPEYKTLGASCCDCYARIATPEIKVKKGERVLINLGFAIELPEGYEAIIRPRSSMSLHGKDVCIGTIDSDYRGEVKACIINNDKEDFEIHNGDRIAQMKIQKTEQWIFNEVSELSETKRGVGGFGSTGY